QCHAAVEVAAVGQAGHLHGLAARVGLTHLGVELAGLCLGGVARQGRDGGDRLGLRGGRRLLDRRSGRGRRGGRRRGGVEGREEEVAEGGEDQRADRECDVAGGAGHGGSLSVGACRGGGGGCDRDGGGGRGGGVTGGPSAHAGPPIGWWGAPGPQPAGQVYGQRG